MGDDRLKNAIETVARKVVAEEWTNNPYDLTGIDDLEITDDDARAIVDRAWHLALDGRPSAEQYDAAVEFLESRTGAGEHG